MRLLFLIDQIHLHGGAEKILSQKINCLIKIYNYDIYLLTNEQKNKDFVYFLEPNLRWKDLRINYYRELSYFHPLNLLKSFAHYFKLKNEIKKINPDIIISVSFTPEQYFLPFIAKHIPKVKEFHSSGVTIKKPSSSIEKAKHRLFLMFNRYDALVVLNEDEKQYYPFKKLAVIPNFIHIEENQTIFTKEKTILAAGRIAAVKQFDHLIKAWALIANDFPEWQVKIFGEGNQNLIQELKTLITDLKVPNIKLMGATNNLQQEMQKAAVYAMTSATECFPMVLLEAQAAGMALISYDCPNGPRNIITHNIDGVLTPHNEIAIFADKLSTLMTNETLRSVMGYNAKQGVNIFAQARVMQQWNDLFVKLNRN